MALVFLHSGWGSLILYIFFLDFFLKVDSAEMKNRFMTGSNFPCSSAGLQLLISSIALSQVIGPLGRLEKGKCSVLQHSLIIRLKLVVSCMHPTKQRSSYLENTDPFSRVEKLCRILHGRSQRCLRDNRLLCTWNTKTIWCVGGNSDFSLVAEEVSQTRSLSGTDKITIELSWSKACLM